MQATRLAIVTDEGGLCPTGVCVSVTEFLVDGTWQATDQSGEATSGNVDVSVLLGLAPAVDQSDIVTGPFDGTCPTAFDGFERHYQLLDPGSLEPVLSVLTCRDAVDPDSPAIAELDRLVRAVQDDLADD